MLKIIQFFLLIILSIISISCQTAVSVELIHKPSQTFYETYQLQNRYLKNFIDNGILFTTAIKKSNHNDSLVWVGCYSKSKSSVFIKEYVIQSNGIQKTITINKNCVMDTLEQKDGKVYDVYQDTIKVIKVEQKKLLNFVDEDNKIRAKVTYLLKGKNKEINFLIDKIIIKQNIFPT